MGLSILLVMGQVASSMASNMTHTHFDHCALLYDMDFNDSIMHHTKHCLF